MTSPGPREIRAARDTALTAHTWLATPSERTARRALDVMSRRPSHACRVHHVEVY
jgi:hypothetical protein